LAVIPEHVVGPDVLPRGPKAIADAIDPGAWDAVWFHSEAELLTGPKRGGPAYGVRFTQDGRRGWAVWVDGTFLGGFLYQGGPPVRLRSKELKTLLAQPVDEPVHPADEPVHPQLF